MRKDDPGSPDFNLQILFKYPLLSHAPLMALTEEAYFDERTGQTTNPSLAEYHVPVNSHIPKIDVYFLDIPDAYTPLGAHGIGEIGIA